jgi:hypothetical protein
MVFAGRLPRAARPAGAWCGVQGTFAVSGVETKNRRLKILPYEVLSDYDCSLYLDSNLVLLGDLSRLYSLWLRGRPFIAWRHPQRGWVFDELHVLLASSRADPSGIIDQYVFFSEEGVPDAVPMIEASFLWRAIATLKSNCLWKGCGII